MKYMSRPKRAAAVKDIDIADILCQKYRIDIGNCDIYPPLVHPRQRVELRDRLSGYIYRGCEENGAKIVAAVFSRVGGGCYVKRV